MLEGGDLVHTYRTLSEEISLMGGLKTWRWRQMRRWFWLEYYTGTERGYAKEGMHATFKCPHADEKKKQINWHLLIMLTKHNYANYHHHYMCTSPWNISQLLSECYTRRVQICIILLLYFAIIFCTLLVKHFNEHAITVVPKTWEVQC